MENFLLNNNLSDPDDFDSLLNLATFTRILVAESNIPELTRLIKHTVHNGHREALSWIIGILQEEFEKEPCSLPPFECPLGKSIPDYDAFTQILRVDFSSLKNSVEKVLDDHGEVASFFNILTYETAYSAIRLVSAENFDTRDNDYVLYKLTFSRP